LLLLKALACSLVKISKDNQFLESLKAEGPEGPLTGHFLRVKPVRLSWSLEVEECKVLMNHVNCWPSVSGNETYVSIEYEASINGMIPGNSVLEWSIVLIDNSNRMWIYGSSVFLQQIHRYFSPFLSVSATSTLAT
ncbi:Coatomer subunit delta, partial [Cucurbita argyrosperma subsp. sororia]